MSIKRNLSVVLYTLATSLPLTPAFAQAQTYTADARQGATPRVDAFSVSPLKRLRPGSELEFTLSGTRGAEVTLEIAGASNSVKMEENQPGKYEGWYVVRPRDSVTSASLVTARMLKDGRTTTASLDQSVVRGATSPTANLVKIAEFTVAAPDGVRPGDELTFAMAGTPGAKAAVAVKGVRDRIALTEVSRGAYEGSYTVRRQDRPDDSLSSTGYLTVNSKESTQRFERQNVVTRDAWRDGPVNQPRAVQACANCGVVEAVNIVESKSDGNNVVGTIAGGVLGGVLGHQVGGGTGKDLATIAGAVGGAYAGNRVESNMAKSKQYQVIVRLENTTTQTFVYAADPAIKVGTRVKIENNAIVQL